MRIGSVSDWAKEHGVSRQGAYKRIAEHGIPFVSPGRIDLDVANQIWDASMNPAKQRGGEAGGIAAAEARQSGLFNDDEDDDAPAIPGGGGAGDGGAQARETRSMLGRAQLQRELLRIKRERITIEQMEGKLVPLADVRAFEAMTFSAVKNELVIIGSELADDLAECVDPIRCRAMVEGRINQALSRLAEWSPEADS